MYQIYRFEMSFRIQILRMSFNYFNFFYYVGDDIYQTSNQCTETLFIFYYSAKENFVAEKDNFRKPIIF